MEYKKITVSVKEASEIFSIPIGGLRAHLFRRDFNGLKESGAIIQIGRKLLIHCERFENWLLSFPRN